MLVWDKSLEDSHPGPWPGLACLGWAASQPASHPTSQPASQTTSQPASQPASQHASKEANDLDPPAWPGLAWFGLGLALGRGLSDM